MISIWKFFLNFLFCCSHFLNIFLKSILLRTQNSIFIETEEKRKAIINFYQIKQLKDNISNQLTQVNILTNWLQKQSFSQSPKLHKFSPYLCKYYNSINQMQSMNKNHQLDPFKEFFNKMNNDLSGWLKNQKQINTFHQDYKNTLSMLLDDPQSQKILVNLGENCYMKAKKINKKIVIRCKEDLYVEFENKQAIPIVKSLVKLYEEKLQVCKTQICKIMTSMRQMESLIVQYQKVG